MKEKQSIEWKNAIGSNRYFDDEFELGMSKVAQIIFDAVCVTLFICSARLMLGDVYSWGGLTETNIYTIAFVAVVVSILMELSLKLNKILRPLSRLVFLVVGCLFFVHNIFLGDASEDIQMGMNSITPIIITDINDYYGGVITNVPDEFMYYVGYEATDEIKENMLLTVDYYTFFLTFVLMWIVKITKMNILAVIAPILIMVCEFLIGYSPELEGIIQMVVAVLLANVLPWKKPDFCLAQGRKYITFGSIRFFSWIVLGISVYFVAHMIKWIGMDSTYDLLIYSDDLNEFQTELVEQIGDFSFGDFIGGGGYETTVKLTNDKPKFKNEKLFSLKMKSEPYDTIYLKGFYLNEYEDGTWKQDTNEFEDACEEIAEEIGYDSSQISKEIELLGISKIKIGYEVEELSDLEVADKVTMTYENRGKNVYLPYFIELENEEVTVVGESNFKKKSGLDEIQFWMWRYGSEYEERLGYFDTGVEYVWESWYEEYVMEEYLDVPENMPSVQKIAEELTESDWFDSYMQYDTVNEIRMEKAEKVQNWMEENTKYSMKLDELPKDTDPIEYFLGVSKKGYCMHYASASVMLLREMGVPARYVSGYIIKDDAVIHEDDEYEAIVVDNRAHAWVEIYLDGIGWVPIEVTKGYIVEEEENTPVNPNQQPNANPQPTTKPQEETTTKPEETTTKKVEKETEEETTKRVSEKNDNLIPGIGVSGENGNVVKLFVYCVCAIIAVALILCIVLRLYINSHKKFLEDMKKRRKNRVIKTVNRKIYRKMCLTGKIIRKGINDEEYKAALIKNYPEIKAEDWDKYMAIVKAAAFSKKEFKAKEMIFCYGIYKRICKKNKS